MPTSNEAILVERFFKALDVLKTLKKIRGVQTFTRKYNIDRRNMMKLKKEPTIMFDAVWLMYLAQDYGVNAKWLLTGEGNIMRGVSADAL